MNYATEAWVAVNPDLLAGCEEELRRRDAEAKHRHREADESVAEETRRAEAEYEAECAQIKARRELDFEREKAALQERRTGGLLNVWEYRELLEGLVKKLDAPMPARKPPVAPNKTLGPAKKPRARPFVEILVASKTEVTTRTAVNAQGLGPSKANSKEEAVDIDDWAIKEPAPGWAKVATPAGYKVCNQCMSRGVPCFPRYVQSGVVPRKGAGLKACQACAQRKSHCSHSRFRGNSKRARTAGDVAPAGFDWGRVGCMPSAPGVPPARPANASFFENAIAAAKFEIAS
ncbi:hypothetical protein BC834DRAFT_670821 [Gloeopeniophorella convolvens]|nr:hypothetical protein BC834DRAFT_670821 [Gloeopeniophorella convolvens]